jgi:DNA-directed RNA polymerase specialized sigma24 family protein
MSAACTVARAAVPPIDVLVLESRGLVYSLAGKYSRAARARNIDPDDLIGEGMLALCRAAAAYRSDAGARFSTFAFVAIRHAIWGMFRSRRYRWEFIQMPADKSGIDDLLSQPEQCNGGWLSKCRWARRHYWACLEAPSVYDMAVLPPRAAVQEQQRFSCGYREFLNKEWAICPWHRAAVEEALGDLDAIDKAWAIMEEIYRATWSATQREALKKLRNIVGPEAYYAGAWPPPVPLWRFSSRD